MADIIIFLNFQVISPKIPEPKPTMLHIYHYIGTLWTLFASVVSEQLLTAQFGQYHAVSADAFTDKVAHNCEQHVSNSNRTSECALLCSVLGRPRCFAFAQGPGTCWVCGPYNDELDPTGATIEATASVSYSGKWKSNMFFIFHPAMVNTLN